MVISFSIFNFESLWYWRNIKAIFVGHGHRWVQDTLFDEIKVYETNSFADEIELMYNVVGFDSLRQQITVAKNAVQDILPDNARRIERRAIAGPDQPGPGSGRP